MKYAKKSGLSFSEVIIAFTIITTLFVVFLNLTYNYFIILTTAKERLIALSLAQEGLELAIALRNKQYETTSPSNWLGVDPGTYCLSFDTSSEQIVTSSPPNSDGCEVFSTPSITFKRLTSYTLINATSVIVTSTVSFGNQKISLDTILVNWK